MLKFIGKYLAIGILLGIGMAIIDEIHFQMVKTERTRVFEEMKSTISEMKDMYVIDSSQLFGSNLPDEYFDPSNDLYFSLQTYKDLGQQIEVSGVVTNRGDHVWQGIGIDFEAYTSEGDLVASCTDLTGELLPTHSNGLVIRCPKVDKFKDSVVESVSMKVMWNFHGKRVISHNKQNKPDA
ncbi:hypothetical protein [Bowmanella sp. JS7-9]|uniref:Uncharacterized protein n=1 Tax=Pseudobowmanella zhangzhouensis TaxID=1537679 RepID=A0ABW1XJ42_9ALTE|nr:hypothetical protein [Bowmanella sp. JS7-9]TBX24558.1 hypothetical protein TK45_04620 [Bowmanella sp. JS7-9]